MSGNTIEAWLAGQHEPFSSLESAVIDHDERQQSSPSNDENREIIRESILSTGDVTLETIAKPVNGEQTARNESNLRSPRHKKAKAANESKKREDHRPLARRTGTKLPALANTSQDPTRKSASASSRAPRAQVREPRKRKHSSPKGIQSTSQIKDLLSSSKRDVSSIKPKITRTEIPSSTQSSSQISLFPSPCHETPISTPPPPPPAKRRKTPQPEEEVSADPFSSQSTEHSPWRFLDPDGPHVPVRREW